MELLAWELGRPNAVTWGLLIIGLLIMDNHKASLCVCVSAARLHFALAFLTIARQPRR